MAPRDRRSELTRDELYAQVWAEPMTRVSRQYGLSDRGLAKLCDRMGFPRPVEATGPSCRVVTR
jgi:hypothetical protein